jgi:hypothetical protein
MKKNQRNKKPIVKIRLPIVKKEILASLGTSLLHGPDGDFFETTLKKIAAENPVVAEIIEEYAQHVAKLWNSGEAKEAVAWAMTTGCLVYLMLKNQAEADEMNENL